MIPVSKRFNNRLRGPLESFKFKNFNDFVYKDIDTLVKAFEDIEENLSLYKETSREDNLQTQNNINILFNDLK